MHALVLELRITSVFVKISSAAHLRFVYVAVYFVCRHQLLVRAKPVYLAVFHYDNAVGVLYACNPLRNDNLRRIRDFLGKRLPNLCVGRRIDGAGAVVKNQDFRLL